MPNCPSTPTSLSPWAILKATYKKWSKDKASRLAAAFSYYAIFSIGPLLIIAIFILSLLFGHSAATDQIQPQIQNLAGNKVCYIRMNLRGFAGPSRPCNNVEVILVRSSAGDFSR